MRRRRWRRRAAGWALALLAAGAAGWVGLERLRPPLLIRVTAQEQHEAVQAVAQAEAPRVLIYHTHGFDAILKLRLSAPPSSLLSRPERSFSPIQSSKVETISISVEWTVTRLMYLRMTWRR